ncbi:molybdopterin-dependent oxidoreductase [Flexistipes sp.]|uniref:molybdopterin-dependent oxidoreductase n=1 Tax=Flexistipes sp. TaxID=3088135 RepID=UPI002E1FAD36|nr:molybdopterin-dependent oxidoreductase [Flexistipes sp.]
MLSYCSKDCPDLCSFDITVKGGKADIKPSQHYFLDVPFVCTKLKHFFDREFSDVKSFLKNAAEEQKFCSHKDAVWETAQFLKRNRDKKILFIKGSGSLGYNMYYWDKLFSSFPNCWFVEGSPCDETGISAHIEDFGCIKNPRITNLIQADTIILFGKNAKNCSPHLYAYLKKMKKVGKKIVYIDPVKTATAKLADKFIRINPGADGLLAAALLEEIVPGQGYKVEGIFDKTGLSSEDFDYLRESVKSGKTAFIQGFGLQRYSNGANIVNWINKLAVYTNNEQLLYYGKSSQENLNKPEIVKKNRVNIADITHKMGEGFFDIYVVVGANPVITYPEPLLQVKEFGNKNLICVDTNYTETSRYADYFIKSAGMFAQDDFSESYFFNVKGERGAVNSETLTDVQIACSIGEILHTDVSLKKKNKTEPVKSRKYIKRALELKEPHVEKDKFRLLTASHYFYLNSQLADKYRNIDNYVFISGKDADELNVSNGDLLRVYNETGEFLSQCKISNMVENKTILVYKNRKLVKGWPNMVSKSMPTDSKTGLAYYDTFVNVERLDG